MNLQFEPASQQHISALTEILNYYILNTTVSFYKEALHEDQMKEKVFFSKPYYQTFVAKVSDEVVGYCAVSQWKQQQAYRHTAEINIYLRQDFAGKGIGSVILSHAEHFAKENNIRSLIAGLCSENLPSKRLFEKNGYQLCANFERVGYKFDRELGVMYFQKFLS